jgi:chaperone modulatory protein CbpM
MQTALNEMIGMILEDDARFSLEELCRSCGLLPKQLLEMVDEGIIDPIDYQQTTTCWQFAGNSVVRVRTVIRLQRDLGVNLAGAALAVELLDEIKGLRNSLRVKDFRFT